MESAPKQKSPQECLCGCGRTFIPTRPWSKFASDKCRRTYWGRIRKARATLDQMDRRIAAIERRLGMGPTAPPKGA